MRRPSDSDVTVTYADGRRVIKPASHFAKGKTPEQIEADELRQAKREANADPVLD